jgi:hypothetical protein
MRLWHVLLEHGVDEATELMNGYAHELAEQIRATPKPDDPDDRGGFVEQGADWAADLIDPKAQRASTEGDTQ